MKIQNREFSQNYSIFINNRASHYGGAVHIHNKNKDSINFVNCNFTENTAGEKGGAVNIFNENPNSNSIVKYVFFNSKFNKNKAKLGGQYSIAMLRQK